MRALVIAVLLAGCAAEPAISLKLVGDRGLQAIELADVSTANLLSSSEPDVCTLAEALPEDDLCSLICDPESLRDALLGAGAESGRCYLMLCVLSEDLHAQVGVCLY